MASGRLVRGNTRVRGIPDRSRQCANDGSRVRALRGGDARIHRAVRVPDHARDPRRIPLAINRNDVGCSGRICQFRLDRFRRRRTGCPRRQHGVDRVHDRCDCAPPPCTGTPRAIMSATLIPPTPDRMQRKWRYGSGRRQREIAGSPRDAKPTFAASTRP